ncbi:MAG TPA: carboxyltransferase domain-containing protein, partial [Kofleriaceae bacterium]|nr:carboxyltransferase domain-containing protein [Kofleriaceae bacterium]
MPEWRALGDRAIRFPRPAVSARALVEAVHKWPGVVDVVVARNDVAAYFDREPVIDPAELAALALLRDVDGAARDIAIRVVYDGPDLDDIARAKQLTVAEIQRLHAQATYTVDTIGFAPGFAYLTGLDTH